MASTVICEGSKAILILAVLLMVFAGSGSATSNNTVGGKRPDIISIYEGEELTVRCHAHPHAYWTNKKGFTQAGSTLCLKNIGQNNAGFYYCYSKNKFHHDTLEKIVYVKVKAVKRYTPVEGQVFVTRALVSSKTSYWTNKKLFYKKGATLYFFSINRRFSGFYYCYKKDLYGNELVKKIYIDVQYPAKILSVSGDQSPLNENQTYSLKLCVEGNPAPTTTFTSQFSGDVAFKKTEQGTFTVALEDVQCVNGGPYMLNVENDLGIDSRKEKVLVYCAPAPRDKVKDKFEPRLGDDVVLEVQTMGYPYPTYTWMSGGDILANETGDDQDVFDIRNVNIDDFGLYKVIMQNEFGQSTQSYRVLASGAPEPVTDISVETVNEDSVEISFVSGYDYKEWQDFIVLISNGDDYEEIETFHDKATKHRPTKESFTVTKLKPGTTYNMTIISNNTQGESEMPADFVLFTTNVPNKLIEVLEGDNLTVTCEANNVTDVHWENANGDTLNNTGDVLNFADINRDESGSYKCVGTTDSNRRRVVREVTVDVQYPAKILDMNAEDNYMNVSDTFSLETMVEGNPQPSITFIKNRDGEVGFSDKGTGAFNISINSMDCSDQGVYNLTVSNKIGTDIRKQAIYVYCGPVIQNKTDDKRFFKPRLGSEVALKVDCYGYPYPKYTWYKDGNVIKNHDDSDISSVLKMDVGIQSFGNYFVDVANDFGLQDRSFTVEAAGAPDPVTNITIVSSTYNSVTLSWLSGYNYKNQQTFTIMQKVGDGPYEAIENVTDTSQEGEEWFEHEITGLDSATEYDFTVRAFNVDGYSEEVPDVSVQVNTAAEPEAQKGDKLDDGEIAGVVVGAAGFVVIMVAVAVFLKKRASRRTYEEIGGE